MNDTQATMKSQSSSSRMQATRTIIRNPKSLDLAAVDFSKLPLRYGTESCYLTLTDERYTAETVALRNDPALGRYINYVYQTTEDHERWLAAQLERPDALNFAVVAKRQFAGTLSLYNIEHGKTCELGRMMMPNDWRRIYSVVVRLLGASFAFEVLGVQTLYCVVVAENKPVLSSLLKTGLKFDPRYDRSVVLNGNQARLIGLSIDRSDWPAVFAKMRPIARRFLDHRPPKAADRVFIHKLADVASPNVGEGTRIWQFVVVLPGAKVGAQCNICSHVLIENDVVIGDRVTVKNGVQLWDGLRVGDDVFIGPNATFTNDMFPRSRKKPHKIRLQTMIENGASIGAGAVILPGLTVGAGSLVAAGSVVTRSVAPRSLVRGNPARHVRFLET